MEVIRCCVCNRELAPEGVRVIGRRPFCQHHFARALKATRDRWSRSGLLEIILMTLFMGAIVLLLGHGQDGAMPTSLAGGLTLAVVPALIWMLYIYRQDRIEPEPWALVLAVFALGALLGRAVAAPLIEDVFHIGRWQHVSRVASWVAAVLVVGTLNQLCAYVAVRYSVYLTDEFDEPVDGVIYATAAGLGLATATNFDFVIRNEEVLPLAGATMVAVTGLVHVAAAAILGYGLGRGRFAHQRGRWWIGGAFALSIVVAGGLKQLSLQAGMHEATFFPWASFAVAALLAAVVLLWIDVLTFRMSLLSFKEDPVAPE